MAGEATIGALRVVLGLDSAKFEDQLKSSTSALGDFGKRMGEVAAGIGLASAVEKTFSAIVGSITSAIDAADKLSKASQKFGIPVESLNSLSNAAALSDVSLESLGGAISKVSKNMAAAQDPTSEQALAFKALGISVKDANGNFKTGDQIILEFADKISKFRDGTEKTILTQQAFGKGAADLVPVLNQGSQGIKEINDRMGPFADSLALAAQQSEKFKDTMQLLGQTQQGVVAAIIGESGLLRAMTDIAEAMQTAAKNSQPLVDVFTTKLAAAIIEVRKALADLSALFSSTASGLNLLTAAGEQFAAGNFQAAINSFGAALKALGAGGATTTFAEGLNNVGVAAADQAAGMQQLSKGLEEYIASAKKAATAPPKIVNPDDLKAAESFEQQLQKISARADEISGKFAGQVAPGFMTAAASMKILEGQVTVTGDGIVVMSDKAQRLNDALLKVQAAQIKHEQLTPWDEFKQKLSEAQLAMASTADSQDALTKKTLDLTAKMLNSYKDYFDFLAQGFADAGEQNKAFLIASKAAAVASATINTYDAANKAFNLFGGFPFGLAAAAATVAAGLATVAKIVGVQLAQGGSFKVPGGVSGVDTKLVPLALAPGEQVDVTPAGQGGRRGSREIVLSGLGPKELFTGDMLRGLVDSLNQAQKDGYRLKVSPA